jgi:hypothetical protein
VGTLDAAPATILLWGILLGCGFATETSYAAILVLIGAEATSGPLAAGVLGAIFGCARGSISLALSFAALEPPAMMNALPRFAISARRMNIATIVASLALVATAVL